MSSGSRHAPPVYVSNAGPAVVLERFHLGSSEDDVRRERFVQDLVHDHPEILPMADIEPAFAPLVAICRELPTPAGPLDNLWITPNGGVVLGECKLFRNPQARREVVAQALDYARAISTWRFDDLERAVQRALKDSEARIWGLVKEHTDLDEAQFTDAVERRLKRGHMLILIIGDGIQEGVEALTAHLQLHAGLHAGLALVDLSVWRVGEGLVVVPRVPMKTLLVERGIVVIGPDATVRIDPPATTTGSDRSPAQRRGMTSSEPEFYDQLAIRRPDLPARLKPFVDEVGELGVGPEFGKSLILRWSATPELVMSAGYVDSYGGKFWASGAWGSANRAGRVNAGERYLQALADIIGGQVRRYEKSSPEVLDANGNGVDAARLLDKKDLWIAAISQFMTDIAEAD